MIIDSLRGVFALSLVFMVGGCASQSDVPIPSEEVIFATSMPSPINPLATNTLYPENTPTIIPASAVPSSLPPEHISVSGWFPIPKLTHPDPVDPSTAHSFEGLRIPPLPDGLAIEFNSGMPYGQVPPETIFYQLYLIRKGNARMLWLGIPFEETVGCCGQETPHRIYDSIPFPPIETDNLLIPFVCTRNHEPDLFLIVVAEPPEKGDSATNIRYAWRIDQGSTFLQSVSTQGIECSPNW